MLTAIYAARNIFGSDFDVWDVNLEDDYHEEARDRSGRIAERLVPQHKSLT